MPWLSAVYNIAIVLLCRIALSAKLGDKSGGTTADLVVTGKVVVDGAKVSVETSSSREDHPLTIGQPLKETLSLPPGTASKAVITFSVRQSDGEGFAPQQASV